MADATDLPASARRVAEALAAAGADAGVREMPASTRTAEEAAAACGVTVAQIVKSLVFRGESGAAWVVLTSGANRVHEKRLGRLLEDKLSRADAEFVREATGYAIGGVPPLGHSGETRVVMDEDLLAHDEIWAAAGTPRCVFRTTPEELRRIAGARVEKVT